MAAQIADKQFTTAEDLDRLLAIDAGGVGTWRWDAASDTFHLLGRSRTLLGGESTPTDFSGFLTHLHPDDRERVDRGWQESLHGGQPHDIDFRALAGDDLTAEEYEQAFENLYNISRLAPFEVKTTEGMHYRRYLARRLRERPEPADSNRTLLRTAGVSDGRGFVFVSHTG